MCRIGLGGCPSGAILHHSLELHDVCFKLVGRDSRCPSAPASVIDRRSDHRDRSEESECEEHHSSQDQCHRHSGQDREDQHDGAEPPWRSIDLLARWHLLWLVSGWREVTRRSVEIASGSRWMCCRVMLRLGEAESMRSDSQDAGRERVALPPHGAIRQDRNGAFDGVERDGR